MNLSIRENHSAITLPDETLTVRDEDSIGAAGKYTRASAVLLSRSCTRNKHSRWRTSPVEMNIDTGPSDVLVTTATSPGNIPGVMLLHLSQKLMRLPSS